MTDTRARTPRARIRAWVLTLTLLVFFCMWMMFSSDPMPGRAAASSSYVGHVDPRVALLQAREQALTVQRANVLADLDARWAAYHRALSRRRAQIVTAQQRHQRFLAGEMRAAASSHRASMLAASVTTAAPASSSYASSLPASVSRPPAAVTFTHTAPATSSHSS